MEVTNSTNTEKIEQQIQKCADSICNLKQYVDRLTMIKNQCLIYINEYDKEIYNLREIYRKFSQFKNIRQDAQIDPPAFAETQLLSNKKYSFVVHDNEMHQMSMAELPYKIVYENDIQFPKIQQRYALQTDGVICSVEYDPLGKHIAFSDGNKVHIIAADNGSLVYSFDLPKSILHNEMHTRMIKYSKDGKYLASSAMITAIAIFSMKEKALKGILEGHEKTVSSFLFLKNSNVFVSGGYDGKLCLWDIETLKLVKEIKHGQNVDKSINKNGAIVALSSDSDETLVAIGFLNGSVGIYESSFQQPMNIFIAHSDYLMSINIISADCMIVTTSHDKTVKIWSLKGIASCKHVLTQHSDLVLNSSACEKEKFLLTGSKDETIKGWNYQTGELLFSIQCQKNSIFDIDHHPTQSCFVTCSGDGSVVVWDYELGNR